MLGIQLKLVTCALENCFIYHIPTTPVISIPLIGHRFVISIDPSASSPCFTYKTFP